MGACRAAAGAMQATLAMLAMLAIASTVGCTGSPAGANAPTMSTSALAEQAAASLVGTTPPEWQAELWMNSPPLRLSDLRGKVVLVRWWTSDCPYCAASAPALRAFDKEYRGRGLVVLGMYHHKDDGAFDPKVYEKTAHDYGFTFPLAFDPQWRTLNAWRRNVDTGWTSMTFVLDKRGVIRHVHPGGQYVEGDAAHARLRAVVERLLDEATPTELSSRR